MREPPDYRSELTIVGRVGRQGLIGIAALIGLAIIPLFHNGYWLSQLTFVAIYAIAGFGLQILLGFAGQVSLGQAAFLASGAYACSYVERLGFGSPAGFAAAIIVSTGLGLLVALPALRMAGLYLGIATMSFGFIIEEVAARWSSVTGGNAGTVVPAIKLGGVSLGQPWQIYYLSWSVCLIVLLLSYNLLRTPTGRAMLAIRDSEIAARSSGVRVARTKGIAFGLSAAFAGEEARRKCCAILRASLWIARAGSRCLSSSRASDRSSSVLALRRCLASSIQPLASGVRSVPVNAAFRSGANPRIDPASCSNGDTDEFKGVPLEGV